MVGTRRVTSSDVAREAGVSRTTVSFVLNDEDQRIPDETRARVRAAAERLGYVPYAPARLLRGAVSRTVLVLTPEVDVAPHTVGARIVTALAARLAERDIELVWQLGLAAATGAGRDLTPRLVLASPAADEEDFAILSRQFEVPVLPVFPGIDAFSAAASVAQVRHLAAAGHRVVAYARPAAPDAERHARVRERSALAELASLGVRAAHSFDVPVDRAGATAALASALERDADVTAVCAYNDEVALGLLAASDDLGIDVPGRLAVIGVDDLPFAPLTVPALTSVTWDLDDFVEELATLVEGVVAGGTVREVLLPTAARVVARVSA